MENKTSGEIIKLSRQNGKETKEHDMLKSREV